MTISCKGAHFPQDILLTCVRWYVAYPLSYRHVKVICQHFSGHSIPEVFRACAEASGAR